MECPECEFPFSVDILFFGEKWAFMHAEDGWIPDYFPFEEVMREIRKFLKKTGRWQSKWNKMWKKLEKY